MTNPVTPIIDELTRQAVMRFRPEDVARVHRVVTGMCRGHRIEVECPLPAWDSAGMGVALRRTERDPKTKRKYKRTASFVLSEREMSMEGEIEQKARTARDAINYTVLCQIREVKDSVVIKQREWTADDKALAGDA